MEFDFIVIGAGIAGVSAAYELSKHGRVCVVEMEDHPAYHSTGRSAATFTANYGNQTIRGFTLASEPFFRSPPDGFADHSLWAKCGCLHLARSDQIQSFRRNLEQARSLVPAIQEISPAQAVEIMPILRPERIAAAHYEPDAYYLDVDLIHKGFLRGASSRGAHILCGAPVTHLSKLDDKWIVRAGTEQLAARAVINAAGAWADHIGTLAGAQPIGLVPKRRTVILVAPPDGIDVTGGPLVLDVDETFYLRPDAGKILASPADETPTEAADAQPEEWDVAQTVERLQQATILNVTRIDHKWAGLRSFVSDKTPVVGQDPDLEGFYWLAGQGGYGIMTSPAMAEALGATVTGNAWPDSLTALGVAPAHVAPDRSSLRH